MPASSEMEQEELDHAEMFELSGNYAFNTVRAPNPSILPFLLLHYFVESYSTSDEHQLLPHLSHTASILNASIVTRLTPSLEAGALGCGNHLLFQGVGIAAGVGDCVRQPEPCLEQIGQVFSLLFFITLEQENVSSCLEPRVE